MSQPYIDVTEFIEDHNTLDYDGTYYYDHDIYGIVHPLSPKYGINFYGNYTSFNVNSPFPVRHLVDVPDTGIKTTAILNKTLVLLDNNGQLHFYSFNSDASGEYLDDDVVSNQFSNDIINGTFNDIVPEPNYGNDNGAIFIKDNDEVIFHNIPTPNNIDDLIDNRLVVNAAVNRERHFCLVFSTGEILYYNGNTLGHSSYNMIPQDIINNEDYSSFSTSNKVSPNEIVKATDVVAHDGFSLLTFDGNIIVWGNNFQNINDDTGSEIKPVATFDVEELGGNGETYGTALRANGQVNVWGLDVDNRLSNLNSITDIKSIMALPVGILYTKGQGKDIEYSSDSFPNDPVLSGNGSTFDFNQLQINEYYVQQLPYSTDGYFFTVNIHENIGNQPVRVDFKLRYENNKYYIPIMHFMDYEPANIDLEVYSTCKSEYESIGRNIEFSIVDTYYNKHGVADFSKLVITPIDKDQNGVPDEPLSYKFIVDVDDFIVLESFIDNNDMEATRLSLSTKLLSEVAYIENDVVHYADVDKTFVDIDGNEHQYDEGNFYRGESLIDEKIPNRAYLLNDNYDDVTGRTYEIKHGRGFSEDDPFKFQWNHYSSDGADRIDPSVSTIMDMYVLTNAYDNAVRRWLRNSGDINTFPEAPSSEEIRNNIRFIEDNKSTSDQVIYIPAEYKLLFGNSARPEHQAEFKIVKLSGATLTDNEIKSRVIDATNTYFDIDNWDFGESFFFTELAAHIHNQLSGHVASVVVVPKFQESTFGDLFQIRCEPNELFLSTATVDNVVITNQYTNQNIRKYK